MTTPLTDHEKIATGTSFEGMHPAVAATAIANTIHNVTFFIRSPLPALSYSAYHASATTRMMRT